MPVVSLLRSVGNKVYERCFPIYHLLYRFFKAYTDRAERRLLRRILFAGAVAVDAGANIGIYSQFLSRCVGSTGVVHSLSHRLRILADCNLLHGSSQMCAYLRPRWESTLASP